MALTNGQKIGIAFVILVIIIVLFMVFGGSSKVNNPTVLGNGSGSGGTPPVPPPVVPINPPVPRVLATNDGRSDTASKCTFVGSAGYHPDGYVQLTPNTSGQAGAMVYSGVLPTKFVFQCDLRAFGGNGADGFGLFFNKTAVPPGEGDDQPGHIVIVQEFYHYINLVQNNKELNRVAYNNDGQFHTYRIEVNGSAVNVLRDGVSLFGTTIDRSQTGPLFGISARCGGLNNFHCVKNVLVTEVL